jgi:hypothetical protein
MEHFALSWMGQPTQEARVVQEGSGLMNAIGVASMTAFVVCWIGAAGCVVRGIYKLIVGDPRLGLQLLLTYFAFAGFVVVRMLAGILGITVGHVPYHSP